MLFGYKYSNSEGLLQSSAMLLAPSGKSFLNLVKENKRRTKGEQKENKPCISLISNAFHNTAVSHKVVRSHTFDFLLYLIYLSLAMAGHHL